MAVRPVRRERKDEQFVDDGLEIMCRHARETRACLEVPSAAVASTSAAPGGATPEPGTGLTRGRRAAWPQIIGRPTVPPARMVARRVLAVPACLREN
ncbi:hypothetical protein GCM10023085_51040 [Actinomadura viridis]